MLNYRFVYLSICEHIEESSPIQMKFSWQNLRLEDWAVELVLVRDYGTLVRNKLFEILCGQVQLGLVHGCPLMRQPNTSNRINAELSGKGNAWTALMIYMWHSSCSHPFRPYQIKKTKWSAAKVYALHLRQEIKWNLVLAYGHLPAVLNQMAQ